MDADTHSETTAEGHGAASGLVGRHGEQARIQAALRAGRAVAVVGPAGIGKTALVVEAVRAAGRALRRGAAVDYLQSRPYLPIVRMLGHPPRPGDATAVAAEVRQAVGDAVVLLDDLQWADADTIELLPALAATGALVVTARPGDDRARRAVKQIETIGEVVELGPLDEHAALELAGRHAGRDPQLVEHTLAGSGGNPLVIEVLARAPGRGDGRPTETLQAVIDACSPSARSTLGRLALQDPSVDAESSGIGDLVERGLVEISTDGTVRPAAALFAELAFASLPEAERIDLHRRVAASTDDPAIAARHWLDAGDTECAYHAATVAAEQATTAASRAELLVLAFEAAPETHRWHAARLALTALLEIGRLEATRALMPSLVELEPPTTTDLIDRELMLARLALDEERFADAFDITNDALESYGDVMSPSQRSNMLVLRAAARAEQFDLVSAAVDAGEARRIARENGLTTVRAELLIGGIGALTRCQGWQKTLEDAYRSALASGTQGVREATRVYALATFFDGDVETGMRVCDEAAATARRENNLAWEREVRAIKAINQSLVELAPEHVLDELRYLLGEPAIASMHDALVTLLAVAEADHGRVGVADALLEPARARTSTARSQAEHAIAWARAEVAWSAGRNEECVETATALAEHAPSVVFGKPAAAVLARWALLELGRDPTTAPPLLVLFTVQRGLLDEAIGVELLAQPGREREAADAFSRAATLHDRYLRRNALRCRWAAGEALRRSGDVQEASALLRAVAADCDAHGFSSLGNRAIASLRRMRVAPMRTRTPGDPLTSREREVLSLVRQGLTTPAIAARLHLRPSTVDSHIRKAMRRLGATSRREAAILADER